MRARQASVGGFEATVSLQSAARWTGSGVNPGCRRRQGSIPRVYKSRPVIRDGEAATDAPVGNRLTRAVHGEWPKKAGSASVDGTLDLGQATNLEAQKCLSGLKVRQRQEGAMFRNALVGLATAVLVVASLVPDDALARRGGGGGYRGGGGVHRGAGGYHAGRYAHVSRPIARAGVYRGAAYRGAYRGAAYGAAAVGAAAVGAYGYNYYNNYNSGCYRDAYGNVVCPNQY
jgi:hypothetical protein